MRRLIIIACVLFVVNELRYAHLIESTAEQRTSVGVIASPPDPSYLQLIERRWILRGQHKA